MITYNAKDLFSSGPASLERGPNPSFGTLVQSLSTTESAAVSSAYKPRQITQRGTLIADTPAQLEALIDAIDAEVDQAAADLVEDGINTWPGCVMRGFTHAPRHRIGARYAVAYNLVYLQTAV
ncbi:MAG: hypothetical protein AAF085_00750 [Planctomycetota bacterium]